VRGSLFFAFFRSRLDRFSRGFGDAFAISRWRRCVAADAARAWFEIVFVARGCFLGTAWR
jgi:hypothetical protein